MISVVIGILLKPQITDSARLIIAFVSESRVDNFAYATCEPSGEDEEARRRFFNAK